MVSTVAATNFHRVAVAEVAGGPFVRGGGAQRRERADPRAREIMYRFDTTKVAHYNSRLSYLPIQWKHRLIRRTHRDNRSAPSSPSWCPLVQSDRMSAITSSKTSEETKQAG